jgi:protein-L-isoaspartate O-methyltransferase
VKVAAPSWEELAALARGALDDRAFAASVARLRWAREGAVARPRVEAVIATARRGALADHAAARAAIARGELRGAALRDAIDVVPSARRDAWIEEVLDLAHPPLDEPSLARDLVPYVPSGVAEILRAVDATGLGPGQELLDLGAGMGKVVLLASLLTGARARGVELDGRLVASARAAAAALGADGVTFDHGDARDVDPGAPDVVFLYVPFTGDVLRTVLDRLAPSARARRAFVCASAVDRARHPWLAPTGAASSWMQVFRAS